MNLKADINIKEIIIDTKDQQIVVLRDQIDQLVQ